MFRLRRLLLLERDAEAGEVDAASFSSEAYPKHTQKVTGRLLSVSGRHRFHIDPQLGGGDVAEDFP